MRRTLAQDEARAACEGAFPPGCDVAQAWAKLQRAAPHCDPDTLSSYAALYASTIPPVRRPEFEAAGPVSERRVLGYLAACPPAVAGSRGHDSTFQAAAGLVRGFGLSEETALALLLEHYNPRCEPPWTEKDLRHKVATAAKDGRVEIGYLLKPR